MARGMGIVFSVLLFAGAVWQPLRAQARTDCAPAKVDYDRAYDLVVWQKDPRRALRLLDGVIARCPNFSAWFLKGNAHRVLGEWDEALAAYEQAYDKANERKRAFKARAYGALMQHRLGRTCEASRTFQYLGAGSDAALRPPYLAFERSLSRSPMDAEKMACALRVTTEHRGIGVCPRLNARIPFAYDRANIDANNRSRAEDLAEALRQSHEGAYRYRLVGHTDSRGSRAYNQRLSERRAKRVRNFVLERHRSLRGYLEARGEGEERLLVPDDTEQAHALNRRVEVQVLCHGG